MQDLPGKNIKTPFYDGRSDKQCLSTPRSRRLLNDYRSTRTGACTSIDALSQIILRADIVALQRPHKSAPIATDI